MSTKSLLAVLILCVTSGLLGYHFRDVRPDPQQKVAVKEVLVREPITFSVNGTTCSVAPYDTEQEFSWLCSPTKGPTPKLAAVVAR